MRISNSIARRTTYFFSEPFQIESTVLKMMEEPLFEIEEEEVEEELKRSLTTRKRRRKII
jgi:hypothetical protein